MRLALVVDVVDFKGCTASAKKGRFAMHVAPVCSFPVFGVDAAQHLRQIIVVERF